MEDEDLVKERIEQPKIETLKEQLKAMLRNEPNGKVSLRTSDNIMRIFNDEKFNCVVFDNAGGTQYCIMDFDSPDKIKKFMDLDSMYDSYIYGYVLDGVQYLSKTQKEQLHYSIKK